MKGKMKYFQEINLDDGSILSCDMVRLRLRFAGAVYNKKGEAIPMAQIFGQKLLDDLRWCDVVHHTYRPGTLYHDMFTLYLDNDTSFALGIGYCPPKKATNWNVGFVEFNPNKVNFESTLFAEFWGLVEVSCREVDLVRWDMAQDFPVAREFLMLRKSRARYMYYLEKNSLTEYYGNRSEPGHVKLYDKSKQAGLSFPLTRCESTVDGEWSAEDICENKPKLVGRVPDLDLEGVTGQTVQLIQLAALCQENEIPIEHILSALPKRKRKEVEDHLCGKPPDLYPLDAVRSLLASVKDTWTFGRLSFANDTTKEPADDTWEALMGLSN